MDCVNSSSISSMSYEDVNFEVPRRLRFTKTLNDCVNEVNDICIRSIMQQNKKTLNYGILKENNF